MILFHWNFKTTFFNYLILNVMTSKRTSNLFSDLNIFLMLSFLWRFNPWQNWTNMMMYFLYKNWVFFYIYDVKVYFSLYYIQVQLTVFSITKKPQAILGFKFILHFLAFHSVIALTKDSERMYGTPSYCHAFPFEIKNIMITIFTTFS